MRMLLVAVLAACLLGIGVVSLYAQTADTPQSATSIASSQTARNLLRFRIAVANLPELQELARSYGIAQEGDEPALRERLFRELGLEPLPAREAGLTLRIERSGGILFRTLEDGSEETVVQGPLVVYLEQSDGTIHTVRADALSYNRTRNTMLAAGHVEYVRQTKDRIDRSTGDSMILDLDDSSGQFAKGAFSIEPSTGDMRTLMVSFENLRSYARDVVVVEKGRLTSCDFEPPHYHLRASQVWLFSSGDWAVANATLYVGSIPVLWLPFFYYPSQASDLHPVFGFRSREGAFLQTTTYLLGRQPASHRTTSLLGFDPGAAGSLGRYISTTETRTDSSGGSYLALMADGYAALGAFVGLRGESSRSAPVSVSFTGGLGLSRSVFLESTGYYSPYDWAGNYQSQWNTWTMGPLEVPVRVLLNLELQRKPVQQGSLAWQASFPFFSDPYVAQDFLWRSESWDFVSIFGTSGTSANRPAVLSSMTQRATLSWSWNGSDRSLLSNVRIPQLAVSLVWRTKSAPVTGLDARQLRLLSVHPQRQFFYPESFRLVDAAFSAGGTVLAFSRGDLAWSTSLFASAEDRFRTFASTDPAHIDFSPWYLLLTGRSSTSLNGNLRFETVGLDVKAVTGVQAQAQTRPYLYDERQSPSTLHPLRVTDYASTSLLATTGLSLSWAPFRTSRIWSNTRIFYEFSGRVVNIAYAGLQGEDLAATPVYTTTWLGWNSTAITDHRVGLTLSAVMGKIPQTLSLTASLPPRLQRYVVNYGVSSSFAQLSATYALAQKAEGLALTHDALSTSVTLKPGKNLSLATSASWDFDLSAPLAATVAANWGSFQASFNARKTKGAVFASGAWVDEGAASFRPASLSLGFRPSITSSIQKDSSWNVEAGSTLQFSQNLIQYTAATLSTEFRLALRQARGTSFEFSLASANRSMWRYWTDILPVRGDLDPSEYARNLLSDLGDSFAIWDTARLQRTSFKLQRLRVSINVDAHDWVISGGINAGPKLVRPDEGRPYYAMDVSFDIAVTWKDLPAIKSTISYSSGAFTE